MSDDDIIIFDDILDDIASSAVTDIASSAVTDIVPSAVTDIVPSAVTDIVPSAVTDIASSAVTDIAPNVNPDVTPSVKPDVTPSVVTDVAPSTVTDNIKTDPEPLLMIDDEPQQTIVDDEKILVAECQSDDTITRLLKGVSKEWVSMMELSILNEIIDSKIFDDDIAPSIDDVFNAFRLTSVNETRVVLIGQDPYPSRGDAMGLSFSCNTGVPASLKNIYKCLIKHKLMPSVDISCGDLTAWALQGVLMLNRSLTVKIGESNSHKDKWKFFTYSLIESLCEYKKRKNEKLIFLLWGRDAESLLSVIEDNGHRAMVYAHPSPRSGTDFSECSHFTEINRLFIEQKIRRIHWSPIEKTLFFTDGACTGNGKSHATAGFGLVIDGGTVGGMRLSGPVQKYKYLLRDMQLAIDKKECIAPSNNRGELLGIIYAYLVIIHAHYYGDLTIVSDSRYAIESVKTWYAARKKKGTENELKNLDLLEIAAALQSKITTPINYHHINSHTEAPTDEKEKVLWKGNQIADTLAVKGVQSSSIEITKAPLFVENKLQLIS
jgi:uracil-DNA glycosylase